MLEMTLQGFENAMRSDWGKKSLFMAVLCILPGQTQPEVIININGSYESKLDYYKSTYGDDLKHRYAQGVQIVNYTFETNYQSIFDTFFGDK